LKEATTRPLFSKFWKLWQSCSGAMKNLENNLKTKKKIERKLTSNKNVGGRKPILSKNA